MNAPWPWRAELEVHDALGSCQSLWADGKGDGAEVMFFFLELTKFKLL